MDGHTESLLETRRVGRHEPASVVPAASKETEMRLRWWPDGRTGSHPSPLCRGLSVGGLWARKGHHLWSLG